MAAVGSRDVFGFEELVEPVRRPLDRQARHVVPQGFETSACFEHQERLGGPLAAVQIGKTGLDELLTGEEGSHQCSVLPHHPHNMDQEEETQWRLWRQDNHGNEFPMVLFADREEAEAECRRYIALGHHQHYWVEEERT